MSSSLLNTVPQRVPTWASDRRQATRYPSTAELVCYPSNGDPTQIWPVRVRDVSDTGIGLLVDRMVEVGTLLVLAFPATEGSPSHVACARVVRISDEDDGKYVLGCILQSELTNEILGTLIARGN